MHTAKTYIFYKLTNFLYSWEQMCFYSLMPVTSEKPLDPVVKSFAPKECAAKENNHKREIDKRIPNLNSLPVISSANN